MSGRTDVNPYVLSIVASHCQNDPRYSSYSRGHQCTCSSIMFLTVHHEGNELNRLDLHLILQKGDAVYTSIKLKLQSEGRFVNLIH